MYGCGERRAGNDRRIEQFPELIKANNWRIDHGWLILIANTSNMPVAAREKHLFTLVITVRNTSVIWDIT